MGENLSHKHLVYGAIYAQSTIMKENASSVSILHRLLFLFCYFNFQKKVPTDIFNLYRVLDKFVEHHMDQNELTQMDAAQ